MGRRRKSANSSSKSRSKHGFLFLILSIILMLVGIGIISYPLTLTIKNYIAHEAVLHKLQKEDAEIPKIQAENEIAAAQKYNAALAKSGQYLIGQGASDFMTSGSTNGVTKSPAYLNYLSILNGQNDEIEGYVSVPEYGINLPIYHGTAESSLSRGAGQLYGTSFPVGGPSTRSVICGHTGVVYAMLFTRLMQMKVGNLFYISVLGHTMAYKVVNINIILPSDINAIKIVPGEDLVTLLTCYPYGINTHRLLVTGERVPLGELAHSNLTDGLMIIIWSSAIGLLLFIILSMILRRWRYWIRMYHAQNRHKH
ncbi:MAG: class C sortase [Aeriscardovia sp.]|nr:class C sortase [Aeriscardovia sp.]